MKKKLLIIGGGGAGLFSGATVMQLAARDFDVSMISNEDLFCRCSGPYVIKKQAKMQDTIMPDTMITQFGINLLKGSVIDINYKAKEVTYKTGRDSHRALFDVLVFATGARPYVLPVDGVNLGNVFSVRTPEDISLINGTLSKVKSATVIGGGVIGVEMASALRCRGIDTNLILVEDKPFERLADDEFCNLIEKRLVNEKINIINRSFLSKLVGKKKVEKVIYTRDEKECELKSDLVIFATGVRANKELAESIGVKCNNLGILVDDYFKTNLKDVYAVGDCCFAKNAVIKGGSMSQLATTAVIQGKVAGKNIVGMKTKYLGHTNATVLSIFDQEYGCCGVSEKECIKLGIDYYVGCSKSTDIYQDIKGAVPVDTKLIFNKKNRIIGVEIYGRNVIWVVNLISYAIMQKSTIFDLANLNYASHPSVSSWPFMNPVILACENAMANMQTK